MGEGMLRNVSDKDAFYAANGRVLKNLHELANALLSMDGKTFSHHVNSQKNDFSSWIRGVFKERLLADEIAGLKSREQILRRINEVLKDAARSVQEIPKAEKKAAPMENAMPLPKPLKREGIPQVQRELIQQAEGSEIKRKLDVILEKEKELAEREKELLDIVQELEKKALEEKPRPFAIKEFIEGLIGGFLAMVLLLFIYAKLIMGY